jgi:hypothetical protein
MNIQSNWLNYKDHVFLSPLRFSWYSGISLKGVNSLIENRAVSFVYVEKKLLIPVPSKNYFALMQAETSELNFDVDWNERQSDVPY